MNKKLSLLLFLTLLLGIFTTAWAATPIPATRVSQDILAEQVPFQPTGTYQTRFTPGETGTITVNSPNSLDGATAQMWGFYANPGWVNTSYGSGVFSGGVATINYTIPTDYVSNFSWEVDVDYSPTSNDTSCLTYVNGFWGQFETYDPNGTTINMKAYTFDQYNILSTSASYRVSAQSGTVFPDPDLSGSVVDVLRPWTGTWDDYLNNDLGYQHYPKTGLYPTYAMNRGYSIEVLETHPIYTDYQKVRLYKNDIGYSVELYGYKNASGSDPLGYIWWCTLVPAQNLDVAYDGNTGIFSGTFTTPLDLNTMYFIDPWVYEYLDDTWQRYYYISTGGGTDLLLSGAKPPAPVNNITLGLGYNTIQAAIDAASTGHVIEVSAGTYNEDININKTLTVRGVDAATTIISGPMGGSSQTVIINANNVLFEKFTVTRAGNNPTDWYNTTLNSTGLQVQNGYTGSTIQNCIFTGNRNALYFNNTQGHTIQNNIIDFNRTGLQFVNNVSNCVVQNNQITNNWTLGVLIYYLSTTQPASTNVHVTDNNISGNWYSQAECKVVGTNINPTVNYDFARNWYGSAVLNPTSALAGEPGYDLPNPYPAVYGGTATNPGGNEGKISGQEYFKIIYDPWYVDEAMTVLGSNSPVKNVTRNTFYSTIQAAIDATSTVDGDVIEVAAGTYAENVIVNKSLTINGAGQGQTVIVPAVSNPGPAAGSSLGYSNVVFVRAHNVSINNLTVDGNNPLISSSITVNGVDIDARNGIIEDHSAGIWNNLHVSYVTIQNIYLRGLYTSSGGSGFHIEHNTVQNVAGSSNSIAIMNYGGSGIFEYNNVTQANDAIGSNHSKGMQILHNVVTNSGSGIHTDNNGSGGGVADIIAYNNVSNSSAGGYGIWTFFSYRDIQVHDNIVNNVDIGLFHWGGPATPGTVSYINNTVNSQNLANSIGMYLTTGDDAWGSWMGSANLILTGNTITNAVYGLILEYEAGYYLNVTAGTGNSFNGSGDDIAVCGLGTLTSSGLAGNIVDVWHPGKIQDGVNVAATGGTVNVMAGTYTEAVTVNKGIFVLGAGALTTIIDPISASSTFVVKINTTTGNVKLDGFTIKNSTTEIVDCYKVQLSGGSAGASVEISNNTIMGGFNSETDYADEGFGFWSSNTESNLLFHHNSISHCYSNPVGLERHRGTSEIYYNIITESYPAPAIWFMTEKSGTEPAEKYEITARQYIHHNTINTGGSGICLAAPYGTSYNQFAGGKFTDLEISYNNILNVTVAGRSGIQLEADGDNGGFFNPVITHNTITGTIGVPTNLTRGIRILGNVFNATINDNTISGVYRGLWQSYSWGQHGIPGPSDNVAHGNSITNCVIGAENQYATTAAVLNATSNWWGEASGPLDDDSLNPDPESDNPDGLGVKVSGYVIYDPWWADEAMETQGSNAPVHNVTKGTYYNTIQAAIDDAVTIAGDLITVAPGIYNEAVTISKGVTIQSIGGRDVTTINAGGSYLGVNVTALTGSITFEGFTVQGFTHIGIGQSMWLTTRIPLIVLNNKVIAGTVLRNGIQVAGDNSQVIGNIVIGTSLNDPEWGGSGIIAVNASNVLIQGNTVTGADLGITVENYNVTNVDNVTVNNNDVSGCLQSGVIVTGISSTSNNSLSNISITNNDIQNNAQGLTTEGCTITTLVITGNDFLSNPVQINNAQTNTLVMSTLLSPVNTYDFAYIAGQVIYRGPVINLTQTISYSTIQAAVLAAASGDHIFVTPGEYVEIGQIVINKNLTIEGADKLTTIVKPAQNTGGASDADASAWILIGSGYTVNLKNLTFDGTGKLVRYAIRTKGNGIIDNNIIKNMYYAQYIGWGIAFAWSVPNQNWTISNNTFENIQRVCILVDGQTNLASITGNTFTGKGAGDWVNYGVEVGDGANASISGNAFNNFLGIASTDQSISAGIMVTSYFGPNPAITVTNNTFTNDTFGIMVGYDGTDTSTATITGNTFTGVPCYVIAEANGLLDFNATITSNTFNDHKVLLKNGTPEYPYAIFSTIQGTIDYASEGDIIEPQPDTYTETLNIEGKNNLTITGSGNRVPTIIKPATTLPWNALGYTTNRRTAVRVMDADNLTVSGIVLDCDLIKNNAYIGVLYANSTGGTFQGSTFKNMSNDPQYVSDVMFYARAMAPDYDCSNRATLSVLNNQFIDTGRLGIVTHNGLHSIIDGNTFYKTTDCFGYAMEIGSTSTAVITDNIIYGFDTPAYLQDNSTSAGIYIENAFTSSTFGTFNCAKPVTIEGNEIYNCQDGIVVGNQFNNYAGNVDIVVDIIGNNIYDNINEGILITDEDRTNGSSVTANITGNTITTTLSTVDAVGIFIYAVGDGDLNVTMQNNNISNYDYGVYVYDYGTPSGSLFDLSITNGNTFDEMAYAVLTGAVNWENTPVISGNNFLTNDPVQFYDYGTLDLAAILAANTWEGSYLVDNVIYYSGSFIYSEIKVFLQGPYVTGGTMTHALVDNNYIPLTSPYDAGVVLTALPVVAGHYIVDWVKVELRLTANGAAVQTQSCFLLENGTVVDVTGNPVLAFEDTGSTDFFVIVRHRNHLAIMSAVAHTFSSNPSSVTTVDLTVPGSVYGGDGLGVKVIETGKLAMFAGDADGSGAVQNVDYYNVLVPQIGFNGYYMSDLDLNCLVQNTDLYNYELPNIGKTCQIPAGAKASDTPNPGAVKLNKIK